MGKTFHHNPEHWTRKDKNNRFNKKVKRKKDKYLREENIYEDYLMENHIKNPRQQKNH